MVDTDRMRERIAIGIPRTADKPSASPFFQCHCRHCGGFFFCYSLTQYHHLSSDHCVRSVVMSGVSKKIRFESNEQSLSWKSCLCHKNVMCAYKGNRHSTTTATHRHTHTQTRKIYSHWLHTYPIVIPTVRNATLNDITIFSIVYHWLNRTDCLPLSVCVCECVWVWICWCWKCRKKMFRAKNQFPPTGQFPTRAKCPCARLTRRTLKFHRPRARYTRHEQCEMQQSSNSECACFRYWVSAAASATAALPLSIRKFNN